MSFVAFSLHRFKDIPDSIGIDKYYWNPCKAFTMDKCVNVAVSKY